MPVKIAVIGSFVTDFVFKTPRRPAKGETIVGTGFELAMGGKGANQAVMAALMGAEVSMIGRVGCDTFGDMQLENMRRAGVNIDYVLRDPREGTGCSGVIVDETGDNSIVFVPRANRAVNRTDVDKALPALKAADILLVQLELPFKVTGYAIRKGKALGKRVILDPAPACPLEDYFYTNTDIMTPNETEASILSGIPVKNLTSAEKAARAIAAKGCPTVIITLGGKGALLWHEGDSLHFPPVEVRPVDTTAAGDAFTGSLAVFLGQGQPIEEAVRLANIAGAMAATRFGAQPSLPSLKDFNAFMKRLSL